MSRETAPMRHAGVWPHVASVISIISPRSYP